MKFISAISVFLLLSLIAVLIDLCSGEAGNFYAETPPQAPRIGRRSASKRAPHQMNYHYAVIPKALPRIGRRSQQEMDLPILLATLDQDGDKCINSKELFDIPAVKMALINQDYDAILPSSSKVDEESKGISNYLSKILL